MHKIINLRRGEGGDARLGGPLWLPGGWVVPMHNHQRNWESNRPYIVEAHPCGRPGEGVGACTRLRGLLSLLKGNHYE